MFLLFEKNTLTDSIWKWIKPAWTFLFWRFFYFSLFYDFRVLSEWRWLPTTLLWLEWIGKQLVLTKLFSVADPVSGVFLTAGSGWVKSQDPDPGYESIYLVKILQFFDADPGSWMKFFDADPGSGWNSLMRIRDPGRKLYVSGIREGNYTYPGSGMEKSRIRDSGSGMNVSDLEHLNYYAPFLFDVVFTFRVFFPGSDLLRKRICFNCKMWLPVTNAGRKIRLNFPIMIRNSDLIDRYKIRFFQKKKKKNI